MWCNKAVNGARPSRRVTSRTRSSPLDPFLGPCIPAVVGSEVFSLACAARHNPVTTPCSGGRLRYSDAAIEAAKRFWVGPPGPEFYATLGLTASHPSAQARLDDGRRRLLDFTCRYLWTTYAGARMIPLNRAPTLRLLNPGTGIRNAIAAEPISTRMHSLLSQTRRT